MEERFTLRHKCGGVSHKHGYRPLGILSVHAGSPGPKSSDVASAKAGGTCIWTSMIAAVDNSPSFFTDHSALFSGSNKS